ncbi:MAG: protease HtpX [Bdellovibrionales bacterium]
MQFFRRIFFFMVVNVLVMVTISTVLNVLGVRPYLDANGINYEMLAVFCLVWGFGGAFISLAISRMMAKWMMGVKVIDPKTADPELRWLVGQVHELAKAADIRTMPEVGIYDAPDANAFATGPTRNRALVAVSTGLLRAMNREQVRGVLGHEVAHIANGDMVTMTLVQGVVNAFVMFFARIVAFVLSQNVEEKSRPAVNFAATFVLEILFSFLGMFVVAYVSRAREYRADAGGARLAGRMNMISGLQALQALYYPHAEENPAIATLKISGNKPSGLMALLSTHPPLEERIRRLQRGDSAL